jgi:hypothetical protein
MLGASKRSLALQDISNLPKKRMLNYHTESRMVEDSDNKKRARSKKAKKAAFSVVRKSDVAVVQGPRLQVVDPYPVFR